PGGTGEVGTGICAHRNNHVASNNACARFCCASCPNPVCGTTVTPKVRVQNVGTSTLTSFTSKWTLTGGAPFTQTVSGANLPSIYDTVITMNNSVALTGNPVLKFWVELPNGGTD